MHFLSLHRRVLMSRRGGIEYDAQQRPRPAVATRDEGARPGVSSASASVVYSASTGRHCSRGPRGTTPSTAAMPSAFANHLVSDATPLLHQFPLLPIPLGPSEQGSAGKGTHGEARQLGEVVHIFSHIRQTMHVSWHRAVLPERPVLPAAPQGGAAVGADAAGAAAVAAAEEGEGVMQEAGAAPEVEAEAKATVEEEPATHGKKKQAAKGKGKGTGKKGGAAAAAAAAAACGEEGGGAGVPREFKWVELSAMAGAELEALTSGQRKVWELVVAAGLHKGGGAGALERLWAGKK